MYFANKYTKYSKVFEATSFSFLYIQADELPHYQLPLALFTTRLLVRVIKLFLHHLFSNIFEILIESLYTRM